MHSSASEANHPFPESGETASGDTGFAEVAAWFTQLSRTLKTCRLYDAANPTVTRFREDLTVSLVSLLGRRGGIEIEITGTDLLLGGEPLHTSQTRDEGLAFAFYRDGVRTVRLLPGIEPPEVDTLVDALLRQGKVNDAQDDLVTLLWETQHPHIEIDCVPADGEIDPLLEDERARDPIPWPRQPAPESAGADLAEGAIPVLPAAPVGVAAGDRSDDWSIGDEVCVMEEGLTDLTERLAVDIDRFRAEFVEERQPPAFRRVIEILDACVRAGATNEDRRELAQTLPVAVASALSEGDWSAARSAVAFIRGSADAHSILDEVAGELASPGLAREVARRIDLPSAEVPQDLLEVAGLLGPWAVRWGVNLLADLHRARIREQWIGALGPAVRAAPDQLRPLFEEGGGVGARGAVELLGAAGGEDVVPVLDAAAESADVTVRQAVIEALGRIDDPSARALLRRFLDAPESRLFCMALQRLAQTADPDLIAGLQARIASADFDGRPLDERRLVFAVLASHATDDTIHFLQGELHRGGWLSRPNETRLQSVARCLARIGTDGARAALQKGAESRKAAVRKVCKDALGGGAAHV